MCIVLNSITHCYVVGIVLHLEIVSLSYLYMDKLNMIFRRAFYPEEKFTTIPNNLIRGKNKASERRSDQLSPESLGVLVYLLSHRKDWKVTNKQLSTVFDITSGKVTKICKELSTSGYIKRAVKRDKQGYVESWDWEVYDTATTPERPLPDLVALDRDIQDLVTLDLVTLDLDTQDLVNQELSITIKKEILLKKKEPLLKPEGVRQSVWDEWWEYKRKANSGRQPAKGTVTRQTKDFELMVKAGFDMAAVVPFAISREWQRVGDPTWDVLKQFKNLSRRDDLLGAVK